MRKRVIIVLACLMAGFLFGCAQKQAMPDPTQTTSTPWTEPATEETEPQKAAVTRFVFPEGTTISTVDVGGLSEPVAKAEVSRAAAKYALTLRVNEKEIRVPAEAAGLSVDDQQYALCRTACQTEDPLPETVLTYDEEKLTRFLAEALEVPASNAGIVYRSSEGKFVSFRQSDGVSYPAEQLARDVGEAMVQLLPDLNLQAEEKTDQANITEESSLVRGALEKANAYLAAEVTYRFAPGGETLATVRVDKDTEASFVSVTSGLEVSLDTDAITRYVNQLDEAYSKGDRRDDFATTGGGTVGLSVEYYGQHLDVSAMVQDLKQCLSKGVSGTREALYLPYSEANALPFGGSYVEVNLSGQHLWVYQDGVCVVSTPIVSGCVANGDRTPTGVYQVDDLDRDCWLVGPTWNDFVNYWIGFSGTFGIHDASWRDSFGGDIYLREGSHGCVNLPVDIAGSVYNHVKMGTPVILYGGETSVQDRQQEISAVGNYDIAEDAKPFTLNAKVKYGSVKLQYTSSDTKVVSVSQDGVVTPHAAGDATITVKAEATANASAAELTIHIHVHTTCQEGRHTFRPDQPTCTKGCGTKNPDYQAPTEPTEKPTEPTETPTEPVTEPETSAPTEAPAEPTEPDALG